MLRSGSRILTGRNASPRVRARVATFWRFEGELVVLTCAHAFRGGLVDVFHGNGQPLGRKLGALADADIAVIRPRDHGVVDPDHIDRGVDFAVRHAPCVRLGDNDDAFETRVLELDVENSALWPGGHFIQTIYCGEQPSDSGAPLLSPDRRHVYGVLSGFTPQHAYYTPLAPLFPGIRRLVQEK